MALKQIYKMVDTIFETMTLISQEAEDLTHDEFVKGLTSQPAFQEVVRVRGERPSPLLTPTSPFPQKSSLTKQQPKLNEDANLETQCSNSLGENSLTEKPTEGSDEKSAGSAAYSTDFSSHMSSVLLTPLARIAISTNQAPLHQQQLPPSSQPKRTSSFTRLPPVLEATTRSSSSLVQGFSSIPWLKPKAAAMQ
jgi:hypothetical protein